jgi:muramoyltetrapeptide carboxypeptidase
MELDRAVANVRSLGWEPVMGAAVLAREGYLAGDDALRASDLRWALESPQCDAIWFLRGGYGAMRILDAVDFSLLRARPRAVIGFSDITAIHAAIRLQSGVISYHGPTARSELTSFTRQSLGVAVAGGGNPLGSAKEARILRSGTATGWLGGGNLALLASLCGTRYAQSFEGAILFLEDINEPMYRVDRMLTQLRMSGALNGCRAIAFGHCTSCTEDAGDGARTLDDVLIELSSLLDIPCVAGVPLGHIDDQWTVPIGAEASLEAVPGAALRLDVRPAD